MATTLTRKGQITIPKKVRDVLELDPGSRIQFDVNEEGQVVLKKVGAARGHKTDRFERVRGKAQIKWRTDELMALLRDAD